MQKLFLNLIILFAIMQAPVAMAANAKVLADILVWHVSQETESTWASVASAAGNHTTKIYAPNVQFNWNVGFRGGCLYESDQAFWDTSFTYTYFQAKTTSSIKTGLQVVFPEFFSGFSSGNFFFGGNLKWRLQMNMLDYDFGRKFKLSEDITIRPAVGIKGGSIYQTINTVWNAVIYNATEQVKNNFVGIGPSLKVDSDWHLFKNLSLFGNFATALMWGNWQISDVYSRPSIAGLMTATNITTKMQNTKLGTAMFSYCLGLALDSHSKPGIKVQIGYEMQLWVNQLRIPTFQILPVHGDLSLQGGTCRIIINF